MMKIRTFLKILLFNLIILKLFSASQILTKQDAQEEFREALNSFNQGFYDEALFSLKKVLSFDPNNIIYRFWLANVYYRLGYEEESLIEWRVLREREYKSEYLKHLISNIEYRRGVINKDFLDPKNLIRIAELDNSIYKRSSGYKISSLKRDKFGGYYAVNFASNEILHLDVNNEITSVILGGLFKINLPWDVFVSDKYIYVSSYSDDEIWIFNKVTGLKVNVISKKGMADGDLLGPQYITADERDFIYVTEWGNKRVSKFNLTGQHILSFGRETIGYEGLLGPTGITYLKGNIYVSDAPKRRIEVFEENGNHLKSIPLGLIEMEGLDNDGESNLIISAKDGVYRYDLFKSYIEKLISADKLSSKLTAAIIDANKQLIVSDFNLGKVSIYNQSSSIYEGIFIDITRVLTNKYPKIYLEVNVKNNIGEPIVGLKGENFSIVEKNFYIYNPKLYYEVNREDDIAVSVVVDKSNDMKMYEKQQMGAIMELLKNSNNVDLSFVNATQVPIIDTIESLNLTISEKASLENYEAREKVKTDISLKLASSNLLKRPIKRAVFYFSNGLLSNTSFSRYSLDLIKNYYKNNDIKFYIIKFGFDKVDESLNYLVNETGGEIIPISSYTGILGALRKVREQKSSTYVLEYESPSDKVERDLYLDLSVEVNFNQQSGRGELGYFN